MNALSFNQVSLNPVVQPDNQIWITAVDLAKALGYKKADAETQIFKRNEDEFPISMTQTLKLSVCGENKGLQRNIRIFSLRGCHLVAMFAKTTVAKQFRKWVLDLIDSEVLKLTGRTTTADDRTGLRDAVNALVSKKGLLYPDVYKLVHQRFNVEHIDELTLEQVAEATEYLHRLYLDIDAPASKPKNHITVHLPKGRNEWHITIDDFNGYQVMEATNAPYGSVLIGNDSMVRLAQGLHYVQRMRLLLEHLHPVLAHLASRHAGEARDLINTGATFGGLASFLSKNYRYMDNPQAIRNVEDVLMRTM